MAQKSIHIISQTGSDFPFDEAQRLGVELIPDIVRFGEIEYKDRVELDCAEFYKKLSAMQELPTSSHPSLGTFMQSFKRAAESGASAIICILVTSRMSGSCSTALTAVNALKQGGFDVPVYVYDSEQCSHGTSQLIRLAAEMAAEGLDAASIIKRLDDFKPRSGFYFMLDSLKNARKGGRVGAIKALTADMLGIKPMLCFEKGMCVDFAIARSFSEGIKRITDIVKREADFRRPVTIFHAGAPEKAELICSHILAFEPGAIIRMEYVGPVIGIYAGPGASGLAFTKRTGL